MDSSSSIYCYLHIGGELVRVEDGNVDYKGGKRDGIRLVRGMTFDEFVARVCAKLNIDPQTSTFAYTLQFDLLGLQPLTSDEDFANMIGFSDRCARVYITRQVSEGTEGGAEDGPVADVMAVTRFPAAIVGSNSVVQCSTRGEELTMQSFGFSQRCAESTDGPLQSSRFETAIIGSGQIFPSADAFRDAVYLLSLAQRFRYMFKRNSKQHITVICTAATCRWKITARRVGNTTVVQVHTFSNIHNHAVDDPAVGQPAVRTKRGARVVDDVIRGSPDYLPTQLSKDFKREYGMQLTYSQAWHLKEKAKERIHGLPEFSYKLLPWLCDRLTQSNPSTVADFTCSPDGRFLQMFVALAISIHGFKMGCRPIVVIDSAHMSGPYKGALFSASSYDADDGLFPLAYGLFTSENYEDWLWFLQKLKMVVGERDVVIISDRHQGIIRAVSEVFGSDNHAYCYRHVKENFSSFVTKKKTTGRKGKENALQLLDAVAYARLEIDYIVAMDMLRSFNPDLAKWVEDNNPEHWCMAKFPKMRWDKMTSNLAESFNSWLRKERHHNISVFFIEHMDKVNSLLVGHREAMQKWTGFCGPKTSEKIAANMGKGQNYPTFPYLGSSIKVSIGTAFVDVDLKERTCTCKSWQMSGIPCDHACAAIRSKGLDVAEFVDDWFMKHCQDKIYSGTMHPVVTHDMPTVYEDGIVRDRLGQVFPSLLPPSTKRPPGRPRKRRIESQYQDKITVNCSRCREAGHNRATCTNPLP